jgi:hypothetical protein
VLWADEERGERGKERNLSGREASYLRAVIIFLIPSGERDGASSAVFLVVADPVCIPEHEAARSSWRVRGWKKA